MRRGPIPTAVLLLPLAGALAAGSVTAGDAPPAPPPAAPAAVPATGLPRQTIDLGNGVTFEMVRIPAGEFDMGVPATEEHRPDDTVRRRVRISQPYWLATTEVTQSVWGALMGSNPSQGDPGATLPVTGVSWEDGQSFLARVNEKVPGGGFRLPTEPEWECACRAGSTTRFCFGDDEKELAAYAWYDANSGGAVHPVGLLKPNAWGLHDMHGNAWEWCANRVGSGGSTWRATTYPEVSYGPAPRALRGGGWGHPAWSARSAYRSVGDPWHLLTPGVRLARTVVADAPSPTAPTDAPAAPPPAPGPTKPGDPAPPVAPPPKDADERLGAGFLR